MFASRPLSGLDIITIAFLLALGVVFTLLWNEWAKSILNRHLEDRNWILLSARYCWLVRGPFTWRSSKNQVVFRIEVQDRTGQVHSGYARIGSYWLGLLVPQVEIEWQGSLGPASF